MRLRSYQSEIVSTLTDGLLNGERRQIVVMPHGLGATTIAAAIGRYASARTTRIIVAASDVTVDRLALHVARVLSPHHTFGIERDHEAAPECNVVIVSAATLVRRAEVLIARFRSHLEMIIVDDAAIAVAPETFAALQLIVRQTTAALIGFTASTERADGVTLASAFEHVVTSHDVAWALDEGWLAPTQSHRRPLSNDDAAVIDAYNELAAGSSTLIFVDRIERANEVAARFDRNGVTAAAITSAMGANERDAAVDAFRAGSLAVIVATDLISHLDLGEAGAVILATTSTSRPRYARRVSRVMLPHPSIAALLGDATTADERLALIARSAKPCAIVIEPDELHESGLSVSALLGMPARINPLGKSMAHVRKRFAALQALHPASTDTVGSIDDIERAIAFADPYELPASPEWPSRLRWHAIIGGFELTFPRRTAAHRLDGRVIYSLDRAVYALRKDAGASLSRQDAIARLQIRSDSIVEITERLAVLQNVLGSWDCFHYKNTWRLRCGDFSSREEAIAAAEAWAFTNRSKELRTLERNASWRGEPRKREQERALALAGVPVRRWPASRGDVSDLLGYLERKRDAARPTARNHDRI
jgi:hypothetical protein